METVMIKRKNRIKHVSVDRLKVYLEQGYDQIDAAGNIVSRATGGRMVSLPEYYKAVDEATALEEENAKLKEKLAKGKKG